MFNNNLSVNIYLLMFLIRVYFSIITISKYINDCHPYKVVTMFVYIMKPWLMNARSLNAMFKGLILHFHSARFLKFISIMNYHHIYEIWVDNLDNLSFEIEGICISHQQQYSWMKLTASFSFANVVFTSWTQSSRISYEIGFGRRKLASKFFWNRWHLCSSPASSFTLQYETLLVTISVCCRFYADCHICSKLQPDLNAIMIEVLLCYVYDLHSNLQSQSKFIYCIY